MKDKPLASDRDRLRPETLAAQAGQYHDVASGGVVPTVNLSTTFLRRAQDYRPVGSSTYSRDHNPTWEPAEALLAELEGGASAALFAAGLGAASMVVQALEPGDHVVAQTSMYWGLRQWLQDFCPRWGLGLDLFDAADLEDLKRALKPGQTKLVLLETPSNPMFQVVDLAGAIALAHGAGSRVMVDNTVPSPVLTRPIEWGADLVFHSATKYLNGHSDVLAGALIAAREDALWDRVLYNRSKLASVLGPFEAWLLLRGMRTLYLRVRESSANALTVARYFEAHPAIQTVLYPGLESHPGHELSKRQMSGGFGGMMSLRFAGGGEAALTATKRLKLILRATSLGGVESLAEHRATIEGPDGPVPDDLLRLSIGIEAVDDLIADLDQAMSGL